MPSSFNDSVKSEAHGCHSHRAFVFIGYGEDLIADSVSDLFQSCPDLFFSPQKSHQSLYPFEIAYTFGSSVGEDIRDNDDAAGVENFIGFRSDRGIRAFDDEKAPNFLMVVGESVIFGK